METLERVREKIKANGPKEPFSLEFRKIDNYAITCRCCGQFFVSRATYEGKDQFSVWFKPSTQGSGALNLRRNLPSGTDAKAWASAIAAAYKKGAISLNVPPTREEIDKQRDEINRLRETA